MDARAAPPVSLTPVTLILQRRTGVPPEGQEVGTRYRSSRTSPSSSSSHSSPWIELVAAFESRAIHREATAAFLLFQRACDEERATAEMISRLASLLRRRGNGATG